MAKGLKAIRYVMVPGLGVFKAGDEVKDPKWVKKLEASCDFKSVKLK